jgi:kinesin family member 11
MDLRPRLSTDSSDGAGKKREKMKEDCKVRVVVRCRPKTVKEKGTSKDVVIHCTPTTVSIQGARVSPHFKKTFSFDHVYDMDSTQGDVYSTTVSPIVKEVLEGYNCTVFAYGQTGTGKTYTMEGGSFQNMISSGLFTFVYFYLFCSFFCRYF